MQHCHRAFSPLWPHIAPRRPHAALPTQRIELKVAQLASRCAGGILGDNPFQVLDRFLFRSFALGGSLEWSLVVWPPLFSALFQIVTHPLGAFTHTLLLVAYKRLVVGRLPPGMAANCSHACRMCLWWSGGSGVQRRGPIRSPFCTMPKLGAPTAADACAWRP